MKTKKSLVDWALVDKGTGEVHDGPVNVIPLRKVAFSFFKASDGVFLKIAKEGGLNASDFRVLMYLCATMDYRSAVSFTHSGLANEMRLSVVTVGGAVRKLLKGGYLSEGNIPHLYFVGKHVAKRGRG